MSNYVRQNILFETIVIEIYTKLAEGIKAI